MPSACLGRFNKQNVCTVKEHVFARHIFFWRTNPACNLAFCVREKVQCASFSAHFEVLELQAWTSGWENYSFFASQKYMCLGACFLDLFGVQDLCIGSDPCLIGESHYHARYHPMAFLCIRKKIRRHAVYIFACARRTRRNLGFCSPQLPTALLALLGCFWPYGSLR